MPSHLPQAIFTFLLAVMFLSFTNRSDQPDTQTSSLAQLVSDKQAADDCLGLIIDMMRSTATFQSFVKKSKELNYDLRFRIEGSPDPESDNAWTDPSIDYYRFAIFEDKDDHIATYTRIRFYPKTQTFYEDPEMNDNNLKEISCDETLLAKYREQCVKN